MKSIKQPKDVQSKSEERSKRIKTKSIIKPSILNIS